MRFSRLFVCLFLAGLTGCASTTTLEPGWMREVKSEATHEGIIAYDQRDFPKAYRILEAQAAQNDPLAQVFLGYMYANGQEVPLDPQKALALYLTAAAQGSAEGMNAIGYKYDYGTGVEPNLGQALKWYCMAAKLNHDRAFNNLGVLYREGTKIPRDIALARKMWRQAAALGNIRAINNLGLTYAIDGDTEQEKQEGVLWLNLAIEMGYPPALQSQQLHQVSALGNRLLALPSRPDYELPKPLPLEFNIDIPVCSKPFGVS